MAVLAALLLAACAGSKVAEPTPQSQVGPEVDSTIGEAPARAPGPLEEPIDQDRPLDPRIKVGLVLPLSGQNAELGLALRNAAQLALFDQAPEQFTLMVRDSGGSPDGAARGAQELLDQGVELILGPLFATSVEAVGPIARSAGRSVIAFSNDRKVAGSGVYVLGLAPEAQIARVVGYAARKGLSRFAVLAPRSPYGEAVVQAAYQATNESATQLARAVTYDPLAEDISAEVRSLADYDARRQALEQQQAELKARGDEAAELALARLEGLETFGPPPFDAVILPEGGQRLIAVAPLLAYYDVDPAEVRYLGTAQWLDPSVWTERTLAGGWFAAPPPELWETFRQRYEQVYGVEPHRLAALAYDATAVAAVLAAQAAQRGERPEYSDFTLTQGSGFAGVDGIFRLLPSGETERGLAVFELQRDGPRLLEAAPDTFEQLIN
ncbi:MAG: penicillin-binding protein activator [Kiloniellales bacterium]